MPRRCDIWRVGVARAPLDAVAAAGAVERVAVTWLPEQPSFTFLADPFGLWRDGRLHLFAEAYDYRTRHGVIDCLTLAGDSYAIVDRRTVLTEPWHLSYPFVFDADGETWMLPEAYRSGTLRLYRARRFPDEWEPACEIALDVPAIDATPFFHEGRWWLFYSGGATAAERKGALRIAFADRLTGPWRPHPANPVRRDPGGARPGGTPFVDRGQVVVPVQDCRRTYGGAIRLLRFTYLSERRVETELGPTIAPSAAFGRYRQGLHTLAACGPVTLFDAKRIDRTGRGWLIDLGRRLRRARAIS